MSLLSFPQDLCTCMSSGFSSPPANGDRRTPSFQSLGTAFLQGDESHLLYYAHPHSLHVSQMTSPA